MQRGHIHVFIISVALAVTLFISSVTAGAAYVYYMDYTAVGDLILRFSMRTSTVYIEPYNYFFDDVNDQYFLQYRIPYHLAMGPQSGLTETFGGFGYLNSPFNINVETNISFNGTSAFSLDSYSIYNPTITSTPSNVWANMYILTYNRNSGPIFINSRLNLVFADYEVNTNTNAVCDYEICLDVLANEYVTLSYDVNMSTTSAALRYENRWTTYPTHGGIGSIIASAIDSAQSTDEILEYLDTIGSNSTLIYQVLSLIPNKQDLLYNLISNMYSVDQQIYNRLASILAAIQDIRDYSSASASTAIADLSDAEAALNSQAAALEVSKPAPAGVINQADLYMQQVDSDKQSTMFSWLNWSPLLWILGVTFTLAIISYVIYGKGQ